MDLRCIPTLAARVPKYSYMLKSPNTFMPNSWKYRASPNLNQRLAKLQFTRLSRAKAFAVSQSNDGGSSESKNGECALSVNVEDSDSDSDWPEEEGWGFPISEFFDELIIENERPEDDSDYFTEDEIQWQDDSVKVIPVKGIRANDWEESVFGDVGPLVVLIFERYNRPIENLKAREELDKAIHIFWDLEKPAPRAVMFDARVETELASQLHVKDTPVFLFFKDGKLLYRQTDVLMADDLAKVMAHVFWGANPPECLNGRRLIEENVSKLA